MSYPIIYLPAKNAVTLFSECSQQMFTFPVGHPTIRKRKTASPSRPPLSAWHPCAANVHPRVSWHPRAALVANGRLWWHRRVWGVLQIRHLLYSAILATVGHITLIFFVSCNVSGRTWRRLCHGLGFRFILILGTSSGKILLVLLSGQVFFELNGSIVPLLAIVAMYGESLTF